MELPLVTTAPLDDTTTVAGSEVLLVAGDLNGHIGEDRGGFDDVIGIYRFGVRYGKREIVLDFCQSKELRVVNTMFKKRRRKLHTRGGS